MKPIYIATKARSENSPTVPLLLADGIIPTLVVEPQDEMAYRKRYTTCHFLVLLNNDMGVTYARNAVRHHAMRMGYEWFWMMDDDIKQFYVVERPEGAKSGRNVKAPPKLVIEQAEEALMALPNLAVGAMEYQQYAWAANKPLAMNSYCDVAVLVNLKKTESISYRDNCKEDRDFVLQCLALGYDAARSTRTAFAVPKNGSNKGGLHDAYAKGLENHWSARMTELWPGICERVTKKDGRPDVKIHWKKLRKNI